MQNAELRVQNYCGFSPKRSKIFLQSYFCFLKLTAYICNFSVKYNQMEFLSPTGDKNLLNSAFCILHSAFRNSALLFALELYSVALRNLFVDLNAEAGNIGDIYIAFGVDLEVVLNKIL